MGPVNSKVWGEITYSFPNFNICLQFENAEEISFPPHDICNDICNYLYAWIKADLFY